MQRVWNVKTSPFVLLEEFVGTEHSSINLSARLGLSKKHVCCCRCGVSVCVCVRACGYKVKDTMHLSSVLHQMTH